MKVITCVVNNPIFIEIQYKTLKKYLKNDYEYIVFNDAKPYPDLTNGDDANIRKEIEELCKKLDIKCINIIKQICLVLRNLLKLVHLS